jgi:hypothetical protein
MKNSSNNCKLAEIAIVAALALLGVAITIVTISLQIQQADAAARKTEKSL